MSRQISSMWVGLTGSVSGLSRSFGAAISPIKQVGQALTSVKGILATVGIGIGVGAIVNEFKGLVGSSMESIDVVGKLADRMGIATEVITGLGHAADLAGVSQEGLTGGIEKMLKSLAAAAATGKGPAAEAFKGIGLDAQALFNMKPDEAFKRIADGIAKIQNPANRAATAMAIFGKSGQSLLPLLMSGSKGIDAAIASAERLGLTFSRVDAFKVEAANDAMTEAGKVAVGLGNTFAIQLSPFIEAAAKKFTDMATAGGGVKGVVVPALQAVSKAIGFVADFLDGLKLAWKSLQIAAIEALSTVVDAAATATGALQGTIGKLGSLLEHLPGQAGALGTAIKLTAPAADITGVGLLSEGLHDEVATLNREFSQMFSGPPPSKKIEAFFDSIRASADDAAQAATAKAAPTLSGILDAVVQTAGTFKDKFLEAAAANNPLKTSPFKAPTKIEMPKLEAIATGSAESQAARFGAPSMNLAKATQELAKKHLDEATKSRIAVEEVAKNTRNQIGDFAQLAVAKF